MAFDPRVGTGRGRVWFWWSDNHGGQWSWQEVSHIWQSLYRFCIKIILLLLMMTITVGNDVDSRWGISGNVWQREIVPSCLYPISDNLIDIDTVFEFKRPWYYIDIVWQREIVHRSCLHLISRNRTEVD